MASQPISLPTGGAAANGGISTGITNNQSGGRLVFPLDLEDQDFYMSFTFYEYNRPNFSGNPILADAGTIRLPLPNNMADNQRVLYSEENLDIALGSAINQGNAAGLAAASANVLAASGVPLVGVAQDKAQAAASSKGAGLIGQINGVAVNPFLTMMFKSPAFKQHSFSWKLSPSNVSESAVLNAIINTFRYNQLPDQTNAAGGTLLSYPHIVQITVTAGQTAYFTYNFKPAVIEGLEINFAPNGQPSFFGATRAPTEVEIRLSLTEIEYWLASDYGAATSIGQNLNLQGLKDFITKNTSNPGPDLSTSGSESAGSTTVLP